MKKNSKWLAPLLAVGISTSPVSAQIPPAAQRPESGVARKPTAPAAHSVNWEDLAAHGKIIFSAYNNEGGTDILDFKDPAYAEQITGIGRALTDILTDSILGGDFIRRIETDTLSICLNEYESNHYDPLSGIVYLDLTSPTRRGYVDIASGRIIPLSHHRSCVHEFIHFLRVGKLPEDKLQALTRQGYFEEAPTVTQTNRIMARYGEPPRTNYLLAKSLPHGESLPAIGFYGEGEAFDQIGDIEDLPQASASPYLLRDQMIQAAIFWDSIATRKAFEDACLHYGEYIAQHGMAKEKAFFAKFSQSGLVTLQEFHRLTAAVKEFCAIQPVPDSLIDSLSALDGWFPQVQLTFENSNDGGKSTDALEALSPAERLAAIKERAIKLRISAGDPEILPEVYEKTLLVNPLMKQKLLRKPGVRNR